jgi:hypothetical protein
MGAFGSVPAGEQVVAGASGILPSMKPIRKAISSGQAIFSPCRFSIVSTKLAASCSDSWVPVSSQAMPRPISSRCRPALEVGAVHVGDLEFAARATA